MLCVVKRRGVAMAQTRTTIAAVLRRGELGRAGRTKLQMANTPAMAAAEIPTINADRLGSCSSIPGQALKVRSTPQNTVEKRARNHMSYSGSPGWQRSPSQQ